MKTTIYLLTFTLIFGQKILIPMDQTQNDHLKAYGIAYFSISKGHNVEFIAGPDGFDKPKKSKMNKEYSFTFEVPGIYLYQCTPHKGMGMIALVVVGEDTSNKDAIAKAKAMGKSKKKLKELLSEL